MPAGFKGRALTVFNNIAAAHPDADANTLWTLLKTQLFNHAHVERQREALVPSRACREIFMLIVRRG